MLAGRAVVEIPEEPILTRKNGQRWKIPVLREDGTPRYLVGISQDITERRNADEDLVRSAQQLRAANRELQRADLTIRAALHRLDFVGRQIPGAVWTTDASLRLTFVCGARLAALGIPARGATGQPLTQVPVGTAPGAIEAHESALADRPSRYEIRIGDIRYEVATEPYFDGTESGVLALAVPVTGPPSPG